MDLYDELGKAFSAHGFWKLWLTHAINTGQTDLTVDNARKEDRCGFGRWLHSLPDDVKSTAEWQQVREVHERFHQDAAHVLELALRGKQEDALLEVGRRGCFTESSKALTAAIIDWKSSLVQTPSGRTCAVEAAPEIL